jgi:hypothetical protein
MLPPRSNYKAVRNMFSQNAIKNLRLPERPENKNDWQKSSNPYSTTFMWMGRTLTH